MIGVQSSRRLLSPHAQVPTCPYATVSCVRQAVEFTTGLAHVQFQAHARSQAAWVRMEHGMEMLCYRRTNVIIGAACNIWIGVMASEAQKSPMSMGIVELSAQESAQ